MKASLIRTLFAVIELVALLLIVLSILGPMVWKRTHSDLQGSIARGGDAAVTQYKQATEQAAHDVAQWGSTCGGTIFLAALIGSILCRKPREPRR